MYHVHHWRAMAFILMAFVIGCSKEDVTGAFDKAKKAVTDGAGKAEQFAEEQLDAAKGQVEEQLSLVGSFELTAGEPLNTKACYVSIIPQRAGRSNVLQLQSYRDIDNETFPSVFLQAHVEVDSIAELIGKPLKGRLFAQRLPDGPVLFSEVAAPIEFKITAFEDKTVSAELTGGMLRETSSGADFPVTGKLTGVVD